MTPTEATQLTRLVKAICPQQAFDEYTSDAWAELLADLRIEDCSVAVKQLGRRQVFIAPAEIRDAVRRLRKDRLERTPLPDPNPTMTVGETIEWLRSTRKAIADGTFVREPVAELEDGRSQRDMSFVSELADRKAV